jgi:hypothetical protein
MQNSPGSEKQQIINQASEIRVYLKSWIKMKSFLARVPWQPMQPAGFPKGFALPLGVYFTQNQSPSLGLYSETLYMTVMAMSFSALL